MTTNKTKNNLIKSVKESSNDLTLSSLINGKTKHLTYIIYNKKPYGYFYLGNESLEYYGERKIQFDFTKDYYNPNSWKKKCVTVSFSKETEDNGAYLGNFFHSRKNELCLTKKNIKPADMFPLFDIFIQELKLHKLNLSDASKLELKYCNYSLSLLGLLEKNYTYYNKFGFIPIIHKKFKNDVPETTKKTKKKVNVPEDFNKPLRLTPIGKTFRKISKSVKDIQNLKLNEVLHILEHYHFPKFNNFYSLEKTKDTLFDSASNNIKYRIKEIIDIYNKENLKDHYKYSYNQLLKLTIKEFLSEFILFFCSYKKDNIKYKEEVNYITETLGSFIEKFNRKPLNNVSSYSKLYYYGKDGVNTMTAFNMETKKFIIKQCSKYEISINKNAKTNIIEIIILTK